MMDIMKTEPNMSFRVQVTINKVCLALLIPVCIVYNFKKIVWWLLFVSYSTMSNNISRLSLVERVKHLFQNFSSKWSN